MSEPDPLLLLCRSLAGAAEDACSAVYNHGRHSDQATAALDRIADVARKLPIVSTAATHSLLDAVRRIHSERRVPTGDGQVLRVCAEDGQVWPCATAEAVGPARLVLKGSVESVDPLSRPL